MGAFGVPFVILSCGKPSITKILTAPVIDGDPKKKFDVVQIVCTQEPVFDLLVKETKIYGPLFKIQTMNQFIAELAGGQNV